jgi:cell division septation protein DedD
LLTGPFDSRDDARELVRSLRAQGFDSFTYSSPEGEEIEELQ